MLVKPANLIIRPEKIGDLVISTPVIRAFKETYPDQPLHLLTDPLSAEIVRHDPHLDRIIAVEWKGRYKGQHAPWREIYSVLKRQAYSRAAILYANCPGWNWLCAALGIRHVAQIGGTITGMIFCHKMALRRYSSSASHYADYYLYVAKHLGAETKCKEPRLFLEKEEMSHFLTNHYDYASCQRRIIVHPFGLNSGANFSLPGYRTLIGKFSRHFNSRLFVIGSNLERQEWEKEPCTGADNSLMGSLTIREMMCALRAASIVIGGSSGMIHVAAALGVPVLGLYCPARNHLNLWGAKGLNTTVLHPPYEVCSRSSRRAAACGGSGFCDLSYHISTDTVLRQVDRIIDASTSGR